MGGGSALKIPEESSSNVLPTQTATQSSNRTDRQTLPDPSTEFSTFISSFEERVRTSLLSQLSFQKVAEVLLHELRRLVVKETSRLDLAEGFSLFSNKLRAEPAIILGITELVGLLERGLERGNSLTVTETAHSRSRVGDLIFEFTKWYSSRKRVLFALEKSVTPESGALLPFNFKILHNQRYDGALGLEFSYSLSIAGQRGQEFWAKLSVREPGKDILCRKGWESWSNLSASHSATKFACMVPLVVQSQNVIVESVKHFVPYDALDLPAGEHRVKLQLTLYDEGSLTIEKLNYPIIITSSPLAALSSPVKSPQSKEYWETELESGRCISNLRVTSRNLETDLLAINFDLDLRTVEVDSVNYGEYTVVASLLGENYQKISSKLPAFADPNGALTIQFPLSQSLPLQRFPYREVVFPLAALDLETGSHRLRAEVSVLDRNGRIVCGSTAPFHIELQPHCKGESMNKFSPEIIRNQGVRVATSS